MQDEANRTVRIMTVSQQVRFQDYFKDEDN